MFNNRITKVIPEIQDFSLNHSFFNLSPESTIGISVEKLSGLGRLLQEYLTPATGYRLPLSDSPDSALYLILEGDPQSDNKGFTDESYRIEVNEMQCRLIAAAPEGLARAIQTLRQLFPPAIFSSEHRPDEKWIIAGCSLADYPRFKWRGMHLDVCRHFVSKENILKFIDLIALYKFNRFHLHLTEDQGWRIEIKKYPRLTETGAFRESTLVGHNNDRPRKYDDTVHGGFYTRKDLREIVDYASDREIVIVPEIDMPGHMQAAISAYPELGCTDMTLKPLCHWGVSQHILNVEESTIKFIKDVIDEVLSVFPGNYIHIGGDEAPKYEWSEQRKIQDRMAELGIKSEEELQSWFIGRIASHIQEQGRQVIGWDEILEGGLAGGAAVMSWRGEEGGIEAADLGHDVVMTPHDRVYFDYYQGKEEEEPLALCGNTTLEKVYDYEPVPKELPESQVNLILGSQGQLWTEYMKDFKHIEYMMFPRTCALAENLWTSKKRKDFSKFKKKMDGHYSILQYQKVNYRKT